MKNLTIITLAAVAISPALVSADMTKAAANTGSQMNILAQGVKSLSASGSFTTSSGNTNTNINLGGSYFYTSNIELRLGVNYQSFNSNNLTGIVFGGRYYFDPSQDKTTVPFAGAFYQLSSGSGNNSNGFGIEAGIQYFLQPNISLTPTLVYNSITGSGVTNTSFGLQFGLTYWFK